jgi:hypothetical protein
MRLLSRNTPPSIDAHLTYFTVSEANEFRRLVERSFTAAGRDVAVHPDVVEDRSGTTFQLWNIGALCVGVSRSDWPELIDEHVHLVTTPARGLEDLAWEEVETGVHLRLTDAASVPDPDSVAYARVVAPGLLEVLSVDLPDAVVTPTREELTAHGALGDLLARGRDNLRRLLTDDTVRAETVGEGRPGRFTAVSGDSMFTASLALLLAETVEHFTAEDDWGRGVLVAVPFRHRLLYRTIGGSDTSLALERMQHAALDGFATGPGVLSRDVYWVRDRKWVQATSWEGGKPRVLRETGLREMLKGL